MDVLGTTCMDTVAWQGGVFMEQRGTELENGRLVYGPGILVVAMPSLRAPWITGYSPQDVVDQGTAILNDFLKATNKDQQGKVVKTIKYMIDRVNEKGYATASSPGGDVTWRNGPPIADAQPVAGIDNDKPSLEMACHLPVCDPSRMYFQLFAWSILHEIVCMKTKRRMGPIVVTTPMLLTTVKEAQLNRVEDGFVHPYHDPEMQSVVRVLREDESLDQLISDIEMLQEPQAIGFKSEYVKRVLLPVRRVCEAVKAHNWERAEESLGEIDSLDWVNACQAYLLDMKAASE